MRGHKGSLYMKKVERLIDDEIIDIFNNMLVTYCSLPFDDYRHFMEAGATIIGKYDVYWDNYNKVNIADEIEKNMTIYFMIHITKDENITVMVD